MEITKQQESKAVAATAEGTKFAYQLRYQVQNGDTVTELNISVLTKVAGGAPGNHIGNVMVNGGIMTTNLPTTLTVADRAAILSDIDAIVIEANNIK